MTQGKNKPAIGLLGGSFNPAHDGHLALSRYALEHLQLDTVWWLVSPHNPLKDKDALLPYEKRLAQAAMLTKTDPRIVIRDDERRLDTQYSIDTLTTLRHEHPEARFVYLMGADNFVTLEKWKRWEDIMRLLPIAILRRDPALDRLRSCTAAQVFAAQEVSLSNKSDLATMPAPAWLICDNPLWDISATALRHQL